MTKEEILKKAEAWVNDGDWGYPDDEHGRWMFEKLVEAFTEGAKAMEEYRGQRLRELLERTWEAAECYMVNSNFWSEHTTTPDKETFIKSILGKD